MKEETKGRLLFLGSVIVSVVIGFMIGYSPPKTKFVEKKIIQKEIILCKFYQSGVASYYDEPEAFRKTASGEVFNPHKFTAAHNALPFFTEVMVINKRNDKFVFVIITDRIPKRHDGKRHIDLSLAAAEELDMIQDGLVPVEIYVVKRK